MLTFQVICFILEIVINYVGSSPAGNTKTDYLREIDSMAKKKRTLALSKAELIFDLDGIKVIEHLKEEDREHSLEDLLRDFDGCQNLSITVSTEKEI